MLITTTSIGNVELFIKIMVKITNWSIQGGVIEITLIFPEKSLNS